MEGFPPADPDAYFIFVFLPGLILLGLGVALLALSERRLIRIDSSHIIFTSWLFGRGSIKKIERPEKLELCEHTGMNGHWLFKGMSQTWSSFPASQSEVVWLRKVLDEFERKEAGCRPSGGNVGDRRLEAETMVHNEYTYPSAEYRTLPPGGRQPTESSRTVRSALKTREHNGKPLVRLEHPSEQYVTDELSAGLFVRCPICHAALPHENVWFEEAAGQCAKCKCVFQIGDLQDRKLPKRCRIAFREDETGLHLHQKPRHGNLLTIYLVGLTLISAALLSLVLPKETWLTILFEPAFLHAMGILLLGAALTVFFTIRTFHVHRYIDFGRETVRFRTRWLFWQCCRTAVRRDVGLFYKWEPSFFGGVYIPYGGRRSFYILATETEVPYLVSMVNRWLWHQKSEPQPEGCEVVGSRPPGGCIGDSRLEFSRTDFSEGYSAEYRTLPPGGRQPTNYRQPTFHRHPSYLSGLGEPESEWQMFCPHCGRQFFGKDVDFAHRESPIHCPDCQQIFSLSKMSRFVLESVPGLSEEEQSSLPELPGLRTERKGDKLTIEYAPPPPTFWKKFEIVATPIFLVLFFGGMFLWIAILANDADNPKGLGLLVMMTVMLLPHFPVFVAAFYGILSLHDTYRSLYAGWSIQIDRYRLVIHRYYKGDIESVSFDRREIRQLRRNECRDMYPSPLLGRFPSLLCNEGRGGLELVLRDGTVEPLPSVPYDGRKHRYHCNRNCRWVNYLNRQFAGR